MYINIQRGSSYEISYCPVITFEAHASTIYKEGGNIWTDIQYILSGFENTGLRMSSPYKRVEIKEILNPLTTESSESTNWQKPVDEVLHSKTEKLAILPQLAFERYWYHLFLSHAVRPSSNASTSRVHYCPMNHCSESRDTRRKLDTHFLEAHMPDKRWELQPGIAGITALVSPMFPTKGKKLCWWMSGKSWGYYSDECLQ